jgi:hypothetical protein
MRAMSLSEEGQVNEVIGGMPTSDPRSDEELLRICRGDTSADQGEALNSVYYRYRDQVRAALEREGLEPAEAEVRIGTVFSEALAADAAAAPLPLGALLLAHARSVARAPHGPPLDGERRPSHIHHPDTTDARS